jgi:ubiquinone/menaquinone biosynthesis C-methylase UbiE
MDLPEHYYNPYDRLAPFYDWMAVSLLLPFGGEQRFRRKALEAMGVGPGTQVLELGCGTGSNTAMALAMGAQVTAVDLSAPMLERARRKAPGANFHRADVLSFEPEVQPDVVLLGFILHEMSADIRASFLAAACRLAGRATVGILDFGGHAPFPVHQVFRAYLRVAEPEIEAVWLTEGLEAEVVAAGLRIVAQQPLALGTARVLRCVAA